MGRNYVRTKAAEFLHQFTAGPVNSSIIRPENFHPTGGKTENRSRDFARRIIDESATDASRSRLSSSDRVEKN